MRKLFVILVAIFLMASSAYAWVDTEYGPTNVTTCFMTGTTAITSGSVVVMQTTSPTYPGREVTGTSTAGRLIYGVYIGSDDYTGLQMSSGKWVKIQTYGYTPIVRINEGVATTANVTFLCTSDQVFKAMTNTDNNAAGGVYNGQITGQTVTLESKNSGTETTSTIKAFLR